MITGRYGIPSVSPGAILRTQHAQVITGSSSVDNGVYDGKLLSDSVVCELVQGWVFEHKSQFLLDGFPRTVGQADLFGVLLESAGVDLQIVISLHADDRVLENRVANRRLCNSCGANFQLGFHIPAATGDCPKCGGALTRRMDDTPEVFQRRMEEFNAKTLPLTGYYQERNLLRSVDAGRAPELVFQDIAEILESA